MGGAGGDGGNNNGNNANGGNNNRGNNSGNGGIATGNNGNGGNGGNAVGGESLYRKGSLPLHGEHELAQQQQQHFFITVQSPNVVGHLYFIFTVVVAGLRCTTSAAVCHIMLFARPTLRFRTSLCKMHEAPMQSGVYGDAGNNNQKRSGGGRSRGNVAVGGNGGNGGSGNGNNANGGNNNRGNNSGNGGIARGNNGNGGNGGKAVGGECFHCYNSLECNAAVATICYCILGKFYCKKL